MLTMLRLILPVLVPSWRFFSSIAPSPRIEYALTGSVDGPAPDWHEFWPRPARLSPARMLGRLIWNPVWNETLYLVTCAERLIEAEEADTPPDPPPGPETVPHPLREILRRVSAGIGPVPPEGRDACHIQLRLVFVRREGDGIVRELRYLSPVLPRPAPAHPAPADPASDHSARARPAQSCLGLSGPGSTPPAPAGPRDEP